MVDKHTGRVGILGAGASGLITGHVLIQDGFRDVQLITRDSTVGGVWARARVYPGLVINNVHGEFRFSALPMPPPANSGQSGGRLTGNDMCEYLEKFASEFLQGKVRFQTEVMNIQRAENGIWTVSVQDLRTDVREDLEFDRLVVCTGGCSAPSIPPSLSLSSSKAHDFQGLVLHSNEFSSQLDDILLRVKSIEHGGDASNVVIVGGGKSAQDISSYLANKGRKVTVVFNTTDAFLATPIPLPNFIRKSRLLSIMSPYIELRTHLERFLHTTWLGAQIVDFFWHRIAQTAFDAYSIPANSPLRHTHPIFWSIRTNDEGGCYRPNGFHALVNEGKVNIVSPARVEGYGDDGRSLILGNGETLVADVVILATGYTSSWKKIFSEEAVADVGMDRHPPQVQVSDTWQYTSLSNPPASRPKAEHWASSIYRGIVPAKNINRRDLAINGAVFSVNNGYTFEVTAHWISSYFLGDKMRLPSSAEEALGEAERNAAWIKKRYPGILAWVNESYSAGLPMWNWPQASDQLLEDMHLSSMRSGGNWLSWPFKIIDLKEISTLGEERRAHREPLEGDL